MIAYIPIPEHNPPEEHTPTKFTSHPPDTTQHPRDDMPIHTTQVPQGKHHPTLPRPQNTTQTPQGYRHLPLPTPQIPIIEETRNTKAQRAINKETT
jgi:hypothetical protein